MWVLEWLCFSCHHSPLIWIGVMSKKSYFPWDGWIKVEAFSHWHLQLGNACSQAKASFLCLFVEAEVALERRGKAWVFPCGLSGFCAWAPTSAWVGSQRLWEHLGVPLSINTRFTALRDSKCKTWHYLCSQFSVVRSLLPSKCQNLLLTLLLEHAPRLRASLSYSRVVTCRVALHGKRAQGVEKKVSTFSLHLKFCPQIRNMGFPSYLVLSVA